MKIRHTLRQAEIFSQPTMTVQNENTQPSAGNEKKKEDELTPLEKEEIEALKAYAMGTSALVLDHI